MQMPTHKLTVQVLDNTYRQYIRQYSTRGKFRPVYLCLITFFQFKIAPQIFCTDSAYPSVDPYWIFILFGRKTFSERVSVLAVDTFRVYCTAQWQIVYSQRQTYNTACKIVSVQYRTNTVRETQTAALLQHHTVLYSRYSYIKIYRTNSKHFNTKPNAAVQAPVLTL